MRKYFSVMRPVSIGTFPREGVEEIVNFDNRTYCPEINREAWGYIEYRELSEKEVSEYELILAAEQHGFWKCNGLWKCQGNTIVNFGVVG